MRFRQSWLRRFISPASRGTTSFLREEKGATAVEFALLALPFFSLIYAILETAMVFLSGQILDAAVHDTSRLLRTGQAQRANWNETRFREEVCGRLHGLFDCSELRIRISVVSNFASATVLPAVGPDCSRTSAAADCAWTISEDYSPGIGSDTVIMQVYYKWPTIVNLPGVTLATQVDGARLLSAVRVFRNEPFA